MRVLLVDHDSEGLEAIARAIRGVLELDCVTSKGDALLLLRQNTYDVLIACERAIDGSGLDLLGRTTRTAVPLKRIFAAAPERLQLLGPRLAPFKVQRTINYPIDLEELWLAIAQVTGGPDDETDGTIERVVLDERGIPSAGSVPRGPIPPRPPAPLGGLPPPQAAAPQPAPVSMMTAASGRAATARVTQPAPEPPLRAPPPPRAAPAPVRAAPARAPAPTTVRAAAPAPMRAPAPALQPLPPMPLSATGPRDILPGWTPEPTAEDDFAAVAAQARLGVQRKVVDEASRRKRQRLLTACGIAVVVAGAIVFLIEKFYDPAARAREQVIAAEVTRMSEQQKVTDDLTMIEVDIEQAIINNDLETARKELAKLVEKAPDHPRREFLEKSIDRAAELAKLSPQTLDKNAEKKTPVQAAVLAAPVTPKPRVVERAPARTPDRVAARVPERSVTSRTTRDSSPNSSRTYGTPIGDSPREQIPLNAPINTAPTATMRHPDNSFAGRTIEASDNSVMRTPVTTRAPAPATTAAVAPAVSPGAGSAEVTMPPVAVPAPAVPSAVDVVPAKIIKRVTPVVSYEVPRKAKGYVVVGFEISDSGRVSNVKVLESTANGVFDDAAVTAVRKWTYEPRKENGVAVNSQSKVRLVFDEG